ncbi:adenylate/guanylate cyclase domain-containing protein [Paenisporosarcina cavernae]|uniref:Adenylate/guanylate cyclase domain-containing protein n=1 Tax=Paenisporosarcina cavernae TaxID=2320858 RepID=A0A385YP60_9BACL|nr:adenylate/guanylate cyclase domain-containing protein [Paenisporosarcina cavernae]AYC28465.1 adenylate/guanylate cyclase domain-containing protein [Paenisporosarcina cavernae]
MTNIIELEQEQTIHLPLSSAWDLLTDSNHFNHVAGLFPVTFSDFQTDQSLHRQATAKALGFIPVKWREHAFTWVKNQWFEIERIYDKSPVDRAVWKVSLFPVNATSTSIRVNGHFTYKNALGKIALQKVIIPQLLGFFPYAEAVAEAFHSKKLRPQAKESLSYNAEVFHTREKKFRAYPVKRAHADTLLHHITNANDEDVLNMQPLKFAKTYGFDPTETVDFFLLATKAGVLQQKWSMMCPNCRVPKTQVTALKDVQNTVHCDLCGLDFDTDFDRSIQMQFDVHPAIRQAAGELYCLNGPMNSPHILAQHRIPAGTEQQVPLGNWQSSHRYRVLQHNHAVQVDAFGNETSRLTYGENGFAQHHVLPTDTLTISNTTNQEIVFVVEELVWDQDALTARDVTAMQLYRDLFATEVLAADQEIQVGNMTVLFTDLKSSTALYEKIGDALAYSDVRQHFSYLKEHISVNRGAIVKTIGDSVMAVFTDEHDALRASIAIHQSMEKLQQLVSEPIAIKIGFHSGPVIAVNANDILDYFGRTVNIASRVEQLSSGNDIVMTADTYEDVRDKLELVNGVRIEQFSQQVKGMSEALELVRVNI